VLAQRVRGNIDALCEEAVALLRRERPIVAGDAWIAQAGMKTARPPTDERAVDDSPPAVAPS
jgi:hypothetical protein